MDIKDLTLDEIYQLEAECSPLVGTKGAVFLDGDDFSQTSPTNTGSKTPLTEREVEVLKLMAKGFHYVEVAQELNISVSIVRHHVRNLYGKLHVNSRNEAVEKYLAKS